MRIRDWSSDVCSSDLPARLAAERDAPRDRPAPVVPDDREFTDAQRVGERENIGDQLVGGIGLGLLRLGRSAIAALIGRDTAEAGGKVGKLVAPGAVRFGKAVQEDQRRGDRKSTRLN